MMTNDEFVQSTALPTSAAEAFAWHERPGAFDRLIPPWENVRVVSAGGGIGEGQRVELVNQLGPLSLRWLVEHRDYRRGEMFRDVQLEGPFAHWDHRHAFRPEGPTGCVLEDRIEYACPGGALGRLLGRGLVQSRLERMFRYRHETTAADLAAHARFAGVKPLSVLISGASGLVGSALAPLLTTGGHCVTRLTRGEPAGDELGWNPASGEIDQARLSRFDAVVHLAGESIADGRWTKAKKRRILESRVEGTRSLSRALAACHDGPKTLVCASAIGYYGDRGAEVLDEASESGAGFLPEVCRQWEEATRPAEDAGVRVVHLRIGIVLSPKGGALAKMLTPFRLGGGGPIGDGRQFWSWISIDDLVGAIHHALMTPSLRGAVNAVSPAPVSNLEFSRSLARVLRRPCLLPMPRLAARLALGEMADALLTASTRVIPRALEASGYRFRHASLDAALKHLLG
ncbi:MAG: TIGR01777 family oxidoreductase [Pirellulaceae bacterium]